VTIDTVHYAETLKKDFPNSSYLPVRW